MLYFKLYPFTLLRQCRSFTFLFMYLGELLQYYQSSNNLPQSAQSWISISNLAFLSSTLPVALLVSISLFVVLVCLGPRVTLLVVDLSPSHSLLLWFPQDLESFCSLQTRLNLCCFGLVCLRPSVALLVVILSPSQFFFPCFAQHLELLCSLQTCRRLNLCCFSLFNTFSLLTFLDSLFQPFVFCVETSTRSACCSVLSGSYLNTPYFRRTGSCKLIFHSPKLLSIRSKKN